MKKHTTAAAKYKEGTWFAAPLPSGRFAVGRVARRTRKGEIILAYFFGPKRDRVPDLNKVESSNPLDAVKVIRIGGYGLMDGAWPIIGDSLLWEREKWPIPEFIRRDPLSETAWRVIYADDNPNEVAREEPIPYSTSDLEPDSLWGDIAAAIHLDTILKS